MPADPPETPIAPLLAGLRHLEREIQALLAVPQSGPAGEDLRRIRAIVRAKLRQLADDEPAPGAEADR